MQTKKPERKFVVFYAVTMMYWFALYMYVPILGPYVEYLGGSLGMVGLVVGSYGFSQMLLRIPLGVYSDKLGRRRPFVSLGAAFAAASALGMGLSPSPWLVFIFRSLSGVAAASWVAYTVLFSSYFPEGDASKAMGVILFYTTLAQMIATSLGGFVADLLGWSAPFFIGGLVGIAGLVLSTRVVEADKVDGEPVRVTELVSVGRDRMLLYVSALAILCQVLTFSTIYGFTPTYAVSIGASRSQLSILALLSALPAAFASLRSGDIARRYGERAVIVVSFLVFAFFSAIIPLVNSLSMLYLTQALGNIGRGIVFPVLMGMSIRTVSGDKRATAMGFFQSIYALGMFAGPVMVGLIGDSFGLSGGFASVGAIGVLAAGLAFVWLKDSSKALVSRQTNAYR